MLFIMENKEGIEMIMKAVFPGKYIQGEGVLCDLPLLVKSFGKKGLILASRTSKEKILAKQYKHINSDSLVIELFHGECCEKELTLIASIIKKEHIDVIIGMGGGKAIDTAKIAADRANLPVIIIPTIASTDAPCSGCAILYSEKGVFESVQYQKMNPAVVLVDMKIISQAPTRFLVSGMGDALSTWFEARSCDRTQSPNECGGRSTMTGLCLAKLCYDTLINYGIAAKIASDKQIITPALEHIVEANILLSGIGFESSGLAAAHSIHNGFTVLNETHSFYHGEKVAFGVLAGLQLTDTTPLESQNVYAFCEEIGLPTTLADLGVKSNDRTGLMKVAEKACAPCEGIHHEAVEITPEKVFNAIMAADAMGETRKSSKNNK